MKRTHRPYGPATVLACALVWYAPLLGQSHAEDSIRVTNVRFQVTGTNVVILYDLIKSGTGLQSEKTGVSAPANDSNATRTEDSISSLINSVERQNRRRSDAAQPREFNVTVLLRKESNSRFQAKLSNAHGDIGIIRNLGRNRRIVWDIAQEFPQGLNGSDFYFEVKAEEIKKGISPMWWIGGGVAVLAGGLTAYLISTGGKIDHPANGSFPLPPGRPQ